MFYINISKTLLFSLIFFAVSFVSFGQVKNNTDSSNYIKVKASDNYNKKSFYKLFWGEHYRKEWNTPVSVKKVMLDTMRGGLNVYQIGGSRQTKSLRVTDTEKREYAFRSVDKTLAGALPQIVLGSFIESLANDQVSFSHPFSALAVAPLAEAAKIYHANPELVYVPKQPSLGNFSDSTGDILYTFEQRPDENWETATNFGKSKKIVSTEKMLENILEDNDNFVDQKAFVKARLFDMLIGDWGRHEDQWRWATFKEDKKTLYVPIPRDRDNAFTKFDGVLLRMIITAAKAKHLQTFENDLKDVNRFNFPARNLDHHIMNEVTREEWMTIANELKSNLTDDVIDNAVKQFPPEVYPISGPEIAAKLKARREHLPKWAMTYYKFLTEEVEITGTEKNEKFEVIRLNDEETEINIYKITKEGETKTKPVYHRVFKTDETKEIRLYGIEGNDEYKITGNVNKGIKIRLIGGNEKDRYNDQSLVKGPSKKTKIYDNPGNEIQNQSKETQFNLSKDSSINEYDYSYFRYNKKGIIPMVFFSNEDRFYVGLGYHTVKHKWRKEQFANTQYADVKYSISENGFSTTYASKFFEVLGKWSVRNFVNYDQIRWTNFYGLGNETLLTNKDRNFYRIRSEEFIGKVNFDRTFNNRQRISGGIQYNTYRILNDTARFLKKETNFSIASLSGNESFAGAEVTYVYQNINDSVLPVKGLSFQIGSNFSDNLKMKNNNVGKYAAVTSFYFPLSKKFSVHVRGGGSTLSGDPQFFQYNRIGGSETLRGYQRDRFYGNSTLFNQNELRYITNIRSILFNGKIGVFGLYDAARVWLKGQNSNQWHTSYGGGIIVSPFNRISFSAAYAVSPEDTNFHFGIMKPF